MGGSPSDSTMTQCVSQRKLSRHDDVDHRNAKEEQQPLPLGPFLEMEEEDDDDEEGDASIPQLRILEQRERRLASTVPLDDASRSNIPETEPPPPRRSKGGGGLKNVSFSNLEIRRYSIVIGDHPCCTMGCPLSLGWEYNSDGHLSLDHYEATRLPRRSRQELRTTWEERRRMLLTDGGCSEVELRRAQRKLHRARSCSAKLCERMSESFFRSDFSSLNG